LARTPHRRAPKIDNILKRVRVFNGAERRQRVLGHFGFARRALLQIQIYIGLPSLPTRLQEGRASAPLSVSDFLAQYVEHESGVGPCGERGAGKGRAGYEI